MASMCLKSFLGSFRLSALSLVGFLRCRVECRRFSQDPKPIATGWLKNVVGFMFLFLRNAGKTWVVFGFHVFFSLGCGGMTCNNPKIFVNNVGPVGHEI